MHDFDNVVKYLNVGCDSISFVCMSVSMYVCITIIFCSRRLLACLIVLRGMQMYASCRT